jgi:ABC-type branched-subunit amino acid transport system substrate-binding protein
MKRVFSAVAVLGAAGALIGCGGAPEASAPGAGEEQQSSGSSSSASGNENAIKIGVLTGLTGDYGPWGEAGLAAAQIAADEINEAGGVNGRPVELVVADNRSSTEGAVAGWKKLVEVDKVQAVVGMESDAAVALLDEAASAQVPIMCPACGTPALDDKGGDYVWRLTSGDTDLGVALAQVALAKTKNIVALTQRGLEATEGITDVFLPAFEKGGGTVEDDLRFTGDATTFQAELDKAFSAADIVLLSTGLEPGTRLLTEWQRRGYDGQFLMIPELITPESAKIGRGALEGIAFGVNPSYPVDSVAYTSFAERYEAKAGKQPSPALYEPNYYDQVIVVALAAAAADEPTGKGIRDNLANIANEPGKIVESYADGLAALEAGDEIAYSGASGLVDFDEFGGVASLFSELMVKDGDWAEQQQIQLDPSLRVE